MESPQRPPGTVFIALSGKKQVGKDTATAVAKLICDAHGLNVAVTAFAEPLKELCINILGLKREKVYGSNADKDSLTDISWEGFSYETRTKYAIEFGGTLYLSGGKAIKNPLPRCGLMTHREVLQVMGTDVFRAIKDNVWAHAPFNRDWSEYHVVLLTDCRFPNEKLATEENGGIVIRLERDTDLIDNHPSETALDGAEFDPRFYYKNNGTMEDLSLFVQKVLKTLNLIN